MFHVFHKRYFYTRLEARKEEDKNFLAFTEFFRIQNEKYIRARTESKFTCVIIQLLSNDSPR